MEIEKEYRPEQVEERWSRAWTEAELFRADPDSDREPFCMVIPPPNVTGNLHIGHVLVYTLHDIAARWRRLQGRDVLWLPGTDHAGIATQTVVERHLAKQGTTRHEVGREKFEKCVWDWKETYGGNITQALRDLGSSVDWSRERFTLDEGLSRAVRTVFVRLHDEGLIYRGRYIVNWCPRCHTALSDLEATAETLQGKMWTIRYLSADGEGEGITVSTTRPETLLGDTGIAVHPDDERFGAMIGKRVRVPLTDRDIPILADSFVDPEFGTGAVKVTPAHDPNDFEAGRRLGIEELEVIDSSGKMNDAAGDYAGLDRFAARKRVVADLKRQGLLLEVKPHEHAVGHCQRCHTIVEPRVSMQWFVKIKPLAQPAIEAVESGRIKFVPSSWAKTYFEWMSKIHDWCISRQLWWGHRIPAWYCDACDETVVALEAPDDCAKCGGEMRQDEDVLDTWFSSALWPFSTLGWPDKTKELDRYYPTQLLITGHDIIFFWVARMIMMGLKFMDEVPFHEVYIHGLVRDAAGKKMSKSKGNTVDPDVLHSKYGTDAVRFTMAILAAPGNDIPLAPERMEGYRAFANKLWNASRFVLMKIGDRKPTPYRDEDLTLADRWILSRTNDTVSEVTRALEEYRFDRASDVLYHFAWHQFCDWYIEMAKPAFAGPDEDGPRSETTRAVLIEVLGTLLRLLHPFMPFITEELWHKLPGEDSFLAVADWPTADPGRADERSEREIELIQSLVAKVRNLRAETNIDAGKRIELLVHGSNADETTLLREQAELVATLVRASAVRVEDHISEDVVAARGVVGGVQIAIPLEGLLDFEAARGRLVKDLAKLDKELQARTKKLGNASFLERAPDDVVKRERQLQAELIERKTKLESNLALLGDSGTS